MNNEINNQINNETNNVIKSILFTGFNGFNEFNILEDELKQNFKVNVKQSKKDIKFLLNKNIPISKIMKNLYIGNIKAARNENLLNENKIKNIIQLCPNDIYFNVNL